jgi:hypothetical protein
MHNIQRYVSLKIYLMSRDYETTKVVRRLLFERINTLSNCDIN